MKKSKVLLFGPVTPPYNGQAVAFTYVSKALRNEDFILLNTAKWNNRYLDFLRVYLLVPFLFSTKRFDRIYFVSSRSIFGFLRDLPLLTMGVLFKKKIINHLHGADFKDFYDRLRILKPLVRFYHQQMHSSIVLLEAMKSEYKDFPKMEINVIPNCFDKEFESHKPTFPKPLQVVFLSNIMKSKGILDFLQAIQPLLEEYKNLKVKIAGDFLEDDFCSKSSIRNIFSKQYNPIKKHFGNRIDYIGVVKGTEKIKLLLNASIFVLPTYYPTEAFPISILEAMVTGNAIITTKHNYLPHIISSKIGTLVEKKSPKNLSIAIKEYLENPEFLAQKQSYNNKFAMKNYNHSEYIKKIKIVLANSQ